MDAGNKNVGVLSAHGAKHKERFHVDLTPSRTNIVSLKKLRREAGEAVSDDSSDENENEAEKYIFVKLPRKKSSGALAIRHKVQHNTGRMEHFKSSKDQTNKRMREIMDPVGEEEDVQVDAKPRKRGKKLLDTAAENAICVKGNSKSKPLECNLLNDCRKGDFRIRLKTSGGVLILKKHSHSNSILNPGRNTSFTSVAHQELHSRSSMRTNIKQQGEMGRKQLPCQILPFTGHAPGTSLVNMTGTPKSGKEMLDFSILQLKMLVEHSKTPLIDFQGAGTSIPDTEIQLSPQLKEKLGKVATSTELNEGRISEELIDRLMDILGKFVKRKTIKRILREMILEDLYASKADCKNFKQIKIELVKMIRRQAPSLNIKVYSAPELTKGTYSMGDHLEDKLCDMYDIFIQGLDEDIGPSVVRRLFVKLADLWPKGTVDRHEIRDAIFRAKERRVVPNMP